MSDTEVKESKKGGRGRPKKAAEPRSEKDSSDEPKAKRGRGRPKGSMGKSKKIKKTATGGSKQRGRGRPPAKKSESKESKEESDEGSEVSDKDD